MTDDARFAFGLGMVAVVALALLGSCAERPAPPEPPKVYTASVALPASLRRPCEDGPAVPPAPPLPRTVEAIAGYAEQLIGIIGKHVQVQTKCQRQNGRLLRWIDTHVTVAVEVKK